MSLWKRGRQYWTDFTVDGKRYRKRLGTTKLQVAKQRERELVEDAGNGRVSPTEDGPKKLSAAIEAYLDRYGMRCVGEIDITRPRWRERPGTLIKAVDFASSRESAEPAEQLLAEALRDPGAVEIGHADGLRWTIATIEEELAAQPAHPVVRLCVSAPQAAALRVPVVLVPVVRLPVLRLPVLRLPVVRLPMLRLPVLRVVMR